MALRRWKSSTRHSLSKAYALGFLAAFIVVLLGNIWPIITRQFMPFAIFGETNLDRIGEPISIALPLVYAIVSWVLCYVLFAIVVPSRHDFVRGIRRALKHGRSTARPWEDDAGSLPFIAAATALVLAGFGVMFYEISASGFLDRFDGPFWRLPVALGLVVFYTGLAVQVLELKPTVLLILLVGLLPILVAIVLSAAAQDVDYPQAVIASLSPLALLVGSGMIPVFEFAPAGAVDREMAVVVTAANTGLAFLVLQIAFLAVRWRKQKRADHAACRSLAADNGAAMLAAQTQ
jgi:glucan phosphoethanolaminetransferase (alkaline phosphatase superfamily)